MEEIYCWCRAPKLGFTKQKKFWMADQMPSQLLMVNMMKGIRPSTFCLSKFSLFKNHDPNKEEEEELRKIIMFVFLWIHREPHLHQRFIDNMYFSWWNSSSIDYIFKSTGVDHGLEGIARNNFINFSCSSNASIHRRITFTLENLEIHAWERYFISLALHYKLMKAFDLNHNSLFKWYFQIKRVPQSDYEEPLVQSFRYSFDGKTKLSIFNACDIHLASVIVFTPIIVDNFNLLNLSKG